MAPYNRPQASLARGVPDESHIIMLICISTQSDSMTAGRCISVGIVTVEEYAAILLLVERGIESTRVIPGPTLK
jgi:hypothetical protein